MTAMRERLKLYFNTITVISVAFAWCCPSCKSPAPQSHGDAQHTSPVVVRSSPQSHGEVPQQPQHANPEIAAHLDSTEARETSTLVQFPGKAGARATRGDAGMVVTVESQATRVGVEVLQAGGNAVDAAVAVAFALAVTHPSAGNLGGGGFWLIHKNPELTLALDFRETAPQKLDRGRLEEMLHSGGQGPDSVGIPGTVAGLFEAHQRFGKLPWNHLLEGAIRLAKQGHRVSLGEATALQKAWSSLSKNTAACDQLAGRSHQPPKVDAKVKRLALANTLQVIRDAGRDGFYRGAIADSVVQALGEDCAITPRDLAEYQPRWRTPREFHYRGLLVKTMPLPSAGGVALTESLALMGQRAVSRMTRGSVEHLHFLLEVQRRADRDRLLATTDPDRLTPGQLQRLETRYLDPHTWDPHPIAPNHPTTELGPSSPAAPPESDNTTHYSIVDSDRMVVSATVTLSSAFGSKIATDTGIILNNTLASFAISGENQAHPGQRTTSSMSPTLVYDAAGPVLVVGTPGGDTIASTLMQILSNLIDFQMPLDAAVDAPRVHQSFFPDRASYEKARPIGPSVRRRLQDMGHRLEPKGPKQGDAKCILLTNEGFWGYADPREGGLALGPKKRP
jgi:gamma-glutamyltranspeptidase / glutathione hydrolase